VETSCLDKFIIRHGGTYLALFPWLLQHEEKFFN